MAAVETYPERYVDPADFAREVNLPLLGTARVRPVPAGAGLAQLLEASASAESLSAVVDSLMESRRSVTLRSVLVAGFAHDPECFAVGLSIAREWSRRGLRVAVIDLDFWNPTIVRPPSHPNEGLVDVLEYGCSFGRVAWEIVADRIWMIGPGSHPPEESRIAEHPDWARAGRVFASCVDVAVYVAPLLDRRGLTGKLSKRVDGVLLAASTERVGRTDLRDGFLELWGSDAPMIGCVGVEPVEAPASSRRGGASLEARAPEPDGGHRKLGSEPPLREKPAAAAPAVPAAPVARSAPARPAEDRRVERDLVAALERDVRRGIVEKKPPSRSRTGIWVAISVVGIGFLAAGLSALLSRNAPPRGATEARQPAGEEPVAPVPPAGGVGGPDAPVSNGAPPTAAGDAPLPVGSAPPTPLDTAPPSSGGNMLQAGLGATGTGALPGGAPAADAAKPFRVHVASFRTEAKVGEIVASLRARKLDAWFEPPPPGGEWYRVFVGRFATEAEAATYAQWLLKSGAVDRAQSYPQTKR